MYEKSAPQKIIKSVFKKNAPKMVKNAENSDHNIGPEVSSVSFPCVASGLLRNSNCATAASKSSGPQLTWGLTNSKPNGVE
jgi:hypothetical protein